MTAGSVAKLSAAFLFAGAIGVVHLWNTYENLPRQPALEAFIATYHAPYLDAWGVTRITWRPCARKGEGQGRTCEVIVRRQGQRPVTVETSGLPFGPEGLEIRRCDRSCDGYMVRGEVDQGRMPFADARYLFNLEVNQALDAAAAGQGRSIESPVRRRNAASWDAAVQGG